MYAAVEYSNAPKTVESFSGHYNENLARQQISGYKATIISVFVRLRGVDMQRSGFSE